MLKLEKCTLCLTWCDPRVLSTRLDGETPKRAHEKIDYCVAALAERAGNESLDDAVMRIVGAPIPENLVEVIA